MINCSQELKGVSSNETTKSENQGRCSRSSFEGKGGKGVERGRCRGPGRAQATGESYCRLAEWQGRPDTAGRNHRAGIINQCVVNRGKTNPNMSFPGRKSASFRKAGKRQKQPGKSRSGFARRIEQRRLLLFSDALERIVI